MQSINKQGLVINGYQWIYCKNGINTFSKKEEKGFSVIECTDKQLSNGDIEFMTEHGLSIKK